MYTKKKIHLIFLLLMIFSGLTISNAAAEDKLTIYSPNYFDEQNNVYDDIHFLENEALSFDFCTEPDARDVKFYISCGSSEQNLDVIKNYNKPGCYFSNYNLGDIQCSSFSLFVEYQIGSKKKIMKRTFKKQKESLLVNYILEKDYKSLDDLDLSYFLIVLNDIQDKASSDNSDAYEELKNARDNNNKCWPQSSCDLETTTSILRNLRMATYDDDSRMLEDGKIYIDRKLIEDPYGTSRSDEFVEYEFELDLLSPPSSTIECELEIDGDDSKTYEFDESSDFDDLRIEKTAEENILFECDEQVDEISLRLFQEKINDKEYEDEDKFSYSIDSSSLSDYSDFKYRIRIDHNFGSSEEIECDLDVDDESTDTLDFDADSDAEDLIIEDYFEDELTFDCNDELDYIKFDVYADLEEEYVYESKDDIDYDIDFTSEDKFDFEIFLEYDFANDDEINCSLDIDASKTKNYVFDEDDEDAAGIIIINKQQLAESVKFSCTEELERVEFNVYDIFDRRQVDEEYESVKTFSYTLPADFSDYECIGESGSCLFNNNINSLIAFGDDLEMTLSVEKFTDSFVAEGDSGEKYVYDSNAILDTGKYLYYNEDEDLVDYLKFGQNNDGSWSGGSDTEKIIPTSWAVIGIQESDKDSEHVNDGKKWIYYNEPLSGWGTLEKNSLAYYAIKEKLKPYIKITAQNEIDGFTNFEVENPTIYNIKDVKIKFENNLDEYISFTQNLGDLEGQDYREFNLTSKSAVVGDKTGVMVVTGVDGKNKEIELLKMPINVKGLKPFEIKRQNVTVTSEFKNVNIPKYNILETFSYDCSYVNPFSDKKEEVTITEKDEGIRLLNEDLKVGEYSFDLICLNDKKEFTVPVDIRVVLINRTIEVMPEKLILESYKDFNISVTNIGKDIETLTLGVGGDFLGYIDPAESKKKLAPGETRGIYFTIPNPDLMDALSGNATGYLIVKTSKGFEKRVPLEFYVPSGGQGSGLAWYWYAAIGVAAFVVIALLVWRRRHILAEQQRHDENNNQNDEFDLDGELDF